MKTKKILYVDMDGVLVDFQSGIDKLTDEEILREEGCRDFSQYLAVPGTPEKDLIPDFFLDELEDPSQVTGAARGSSKVKKHYSIYLV